MQQEQEITQEVRQLDARINTNVNTNINSSISEQEQNERVELFLSSVKSQETREKYSIYLKKYMEITGIKDLFHSNDPRVIENEIIKFVVAMTKKGMTYTAMKNYTTAVFSFYKINDIILNTNKISKFMPEQRKVKNDRAYTHEEIAKLLEIADERSRVIILLLASSGMRVGAISSLKIRNLEADNHNKITIYEKSPEQYYSFITPECKKAVDQYLDMRSRYGEKLNGNSPLIREQFDIKNQFSIKSPKTVASVGLQWILRDLARRYNVISNNDIPVAHGFRYFWMNQAVKSKMNAEQREMLLGHKIGLASAYYRPNEEEMFAEYEKAIDLLTIDPANRLQRELDTAKQETSQFDKFALELEKVKESIRRFDEERKEELIKLLAEGKARMQMIEGGQVKEVLKVDKKGKFTKRKVKKR
jgi:integrase